MDISAIEQDGVTVVSITGNLDALTSDEAVTYLNARIDEGKYNLVLDFSDIAFLSSAGLRAVLTCMQDVRSNRGDLRLAGADERIKRVLDLSGFTKIMKYYETHEEAVQSFDE